MPCHEQGRNLLGEGHEGARRPEQPRPRGHPHPDRAVLRVHRPQRQEPSRGWCGHRGDGLLPAGAALLCQQTCRTVRHAGPRTAEMINSLTAIEWTRVRAFCRDKRPDEITPNALYRAARGLKAGSRNTNMVTDSIMLDAVRMWCVKPEPPKEKPVPKHLYITVTGPAMSGKSTVVEVIAQALWTTVSFR